MSARLDLLDLRCIRAIADSGSITGAATLLGYSQPAVTQRLRRAERILGQPLVIRSGRGVALTEAGRRLAQHAVHVQTAFEAAEQDLEDLRGGVGGLLRLAGFPSASPTIVPRILQSLRASHPRLVVTYVEAEPPEAVHLLRDGAVDVALTFGYPGDGRDAGSDGVVERAVFRDTMVLVAPSDLHTVLDADDRADLSRYRTERFIGGCPRCRGHLLVSCRAAGFEPDIVLETDNALAVTGLVAAGLGVALLPSLSLLPAPPPDGVIVTPMASEHDRVVSVAVVSGAERVPAVAACLGAIDSLDPADFGLREAEPQGSGGRGGATGAAGRAGATGAAG